ncbi:Cytochrome b6 complex subunit C [Halomicronema hongdechloris C2206]|uniref:Cytochrome b6 complex subunit C n=1 Tax=Halomicronema hongdechloris C2206 TaxID=1641165 RepID=A0A1Z3HTI6_9CYAN|nr:Cytochrome b6 complex subunit C [Halomicronema hongdechloris C2206]
MGTILLARSPNSPDVIYAVNPTCTHAGCTVDWNVARELFVCPCHQSQYAVDGDVVGGPAPSPLPRFNVKVEGDRVLVKPLPG